ncbi:tyrosine-type recombinase/integrase [Megamonas funiformis]|uniref:tyrosine-type recombinase/integrase n=1 Tax=Megamonas funiformis TaxID=437897 RepID=UPI0026760F74|nr:tyrosine-type recombinase/integrase [Megamonas funiformis]
MGSTTIQFYLFIFQVSWSAVARQNVYWWVTRIAKKINALYIHQHLFRHTHVSLLAEAGVPLPVITERLGHASTKITEEIYLHITKTTKENYLHKFNRIVENL